MEKNTSDSLDYLLNATTLPSQEERNVSSGNLSDIEGSLFLIEISGFLIADVQNIENKTLRMWIPTGIEKSNCFKKNNRFLESLCKEQYSEKYITFSILFRGKIQSELDYRLTLGQNVRIVKHLSSFCDKCTIFENDKPEVR